MTHTHQPGPDNWEHAFYVPKSQRLRDHCTYFIDKGFLLFALGRSDVGSQQNLQGWDYMQMA